MEIRSLLLYTPGRSSPTVVLCVDDAIAYAQDVLPALNADTPEESEKAERELRVALTSLTSGERYGMRWEWNTIVVERGGQKG